MRHRGSDENILNIEIDISDIFALASYLDLLRKDNEYDYMIIEPVKFQPELF